MKQQKPSPTLLRQSSKALPAVLVCLTLLLQACNIPSLSKTANTTLSPGEGSAATDGSGVSAGTITPPTPTPNASATPTPIPTPPPGWVVYESNELKVQLFHPEGWERLPYNDHQFDLRESAGEGWIEIKVIDQESDHLWGLDYIPSTQAKDLLNTLLDAARQDGSFADPQPLLTPSGRTIWISTGEYDLLNDQVMIGIHGLPDRAIVALGHSEIEAGEWDRLAPIYEAIIVSIETK